MLDLCLECKGCKAECPSNVDMAKLKYEFLDRYHKANGYPLRNRIFGSIAALSKTGSFMAPLSNWLLESDGGRDLLDRYAGIDRRRQLPSFSSQTFEQWFRARETTDVPRAPGAYRRPASRHPSRTTTTRSWAGPPSRSWSGWGTRSSSQRWPAAAAPCSRRG